MLIQMFYVYIFYFKKNRFPNLTKPLATIYKASPPPSAFLSLPLLPPPPTLLQAVSLSCVLGGQRRGSTGRRKSTLRVQVHGLKDTAGLNKRGI